LTVYSFSVLNVTYTDLTGINAFGNLTALTSKNNNNLTSLDLSGMANLVTVDVGSNSLTTLIISGCTSLQTLKCWSNELDELDLTGLANLNVLYCSNNNLTDLDFAGLSLTDFAAGDNLFTVLDISSQVNLQNFNINNSPNLTELNISNGIVQNINIETFGPCPNLSFVCLDSDEYAAAYEALAFLNDVENIEFSTACGETAEQDNHVTGMVKFDIDGDGCSNSDLTLALIKVNAVHEGNATSLWTTNTGYYGFLAGTGEYSVAVDLQDFPYFTSTTASPITFDAMDGTVVTQDFCITADGEHPDIEVSVGAYGGVSAAADQQYWLTYKNKGNQVLDGAVSLTYNDNAIDFVSSVPAYTTSGTGLLSWEFSNLLPFETRTIVLTMHINGPASEYPVNIGDVLDFFFTANIPQTDETPGDNQLDFSQTVYYSYDPNNIVCLQGNNVPVERIGEYLNYTVNFENTGSAAAQTLRLEVVIDPAQFDVSSLQVLNGSHGFSAELSNNILTITFNAINLVPDGQGSATFKIKSLATLQANDAVMNQASIVFDENLPVITNQAITTFTVLDVETFTNDDISVYPNPTDGMVTIKADGLVNEIEMYDIQGRLLHSVAVNAETAVIDFHSRAAGTYLIKVITDEGIAVQKVLRK
jgi:uncharacterized repeat protein (TIGR01451 family)